MGRFGKLPVELPQDVKAETSDRTLSVTGPKGNLTRDFPKVTVTLEGTSLTVAQKGNSKAARAEQGSTRAHIANMVRGGSEGWKKKLEVSGPGYRAEIKGRDLSLLVGYSHPVVIPAPESISFSLEKNIVTVEGKDKDEVGHISALVRSARRPNPYTGFGIRYVDETVRRKVGKQAGKTE